MGYNKTVLVKDFSNYLPGNKGAEIISLDWLSLIKK